MVQAALNGKFLSIEQVGYPELMIHECVFDIYKINLKDAILYFCVCYFYVTMQNQTLSMSGFNSHPFWKQLLSVGNGPKMGFLHWYQYHRGNGIHGNIRTSKLWNFFIKAVIQSTKADQQPGRSCHVQNPLIKSQWTASDWHCYKDLPCICHLYSYCLLIEGWRAKVQNSSIHKKRELSNKEWHSVEYWANFPDYFKLWNPINCACNLVYLQKENNWKQTMDNWQPCNCLKWIIVVHCIGYSVLFLHFI